MGMFVHQQYAPTYEHRALTLPLGSFSRCDPSAPPGKTQGVGDREDVVVDPGDFTAPEVIDEVIESAHADGERCLVVAGAAAQGYLNEGAFSSPGYWHVYYDGERLVLVG